MFSCLSLRIRCLPRIIFHKKILIRSTNSDQTSSSYRSASRFSLKIARFLFLKHHIKDDLSTSNYLPLSTYTHYTKRETDDDIQILARNFLLSLESDHRRILHEELIQFEKFSSTISSHSIDILPSQLAIVFLETGLPYIGFGFVDNFVMLVAGETIETFFGVAFCLSTMAAAGLGNAISDVMGISLADRIERTCGRFLAIFGVHSPQLTTAQWGLRSVHIIQLMSKIICIFLGCVLGMCPLLFRDTSSNKNKEKNLKIN